MNLHKIWLKKVLITTFSFIIIIAAVIIPINYTVDTSNLFHENIIKKTAFTLINGHKITGQNNIDERLLQKYIIQNLNHRKNFIVIGSSRTQHLKASTFNMTETNFFNNSVSAATLEDIFAILEMYKDKGYIPENIILGIDPWMFNTNNNYAHNWESVCGYSSEFKKEAFNTNFNACSSNIINRKLVQLINLDYTLTNFKNIDFKNLKTLNLNKNTIILTNKTNLEKGYRDLDGSLVYPSKIENRNSQQVKDFVKDLINKKYFHGLTNFNQVSNIELFDGLLRYLHNKNINIVIYLPPYNPEVYTYFRENSQYKNVDRTEELIKKIAKKYNFQVLGSYNPAKCGFNENDFVDEMHPRFQSLNKFFKKNYASQIH